MSNQGRIADHWTHGDLARIVASSLDGMGPGRGPPTAAELAPLDHLHGRGLEATRELVGLLRVAPGQHLLDIGCGIGGPARLIAVEHGCRVTGIDLTAEFCDVALMLNRMTGLDGAVAILRANALDLPFAAAAFDGAYTQNVSMNIADKAAFYAEAARVVKPGGLFAAAEYAAGPGGRPRFPVPWARRPEDSHLESAAAIRRLLGAAGFEVIDFQDQTATLLDYYERARRRIAAEGPPALGTHVLLGADGVERLKNSARSVEERRVVPVQALCRRL